MISVIVCSVNATQFSDFEKNLGDTIGVPFEIIRIDNSTNKYGICAAYNEGASRAKYEILCFCHEDIIFHTKDWGNITKGIFHDNPSTGVLGIAGSAYKAFAPSGWGTIPEARFVNIIQRYKTLPLPITHDTQNPLGEKLSEVVCVDGVWLCTRRNIALGNKFDEKTFTGFHCYDLDYCFNLFGKHKIVVTFDILLEHFSEGRNDADWIRNTMIFHRKWKKRLPLNISAVNAEDINFHEMRAADYFRLKMIESEFSFFSIMRMLQYNASNPALTRKQVNRLTLRTLKYFVTSGLRRMKLSGLFFF